MDLDRLRWMITDLEIQLTLANGLPSSRIRELTGALNKMHALEAEVKAQLTKETSSAPTSEPGAQA